MTSRIIRVAQDGSGDYRTVQEAIDAIPLGNTCRTVIRISPGLYRQPVYIAKTKNLITLAGLRPELTVLTWNNTATQINHHQVYLRFLNYFSILKALPDRDVNMIRDLINFSGVSGDRNWNIWMWQYYS